MESSHISSRSATVQLRASLAQKHRKEPTPTHLGECRFERYDSFRQRVSELVQDLYDVQVLRGDHFHVWTATDMQPKEDESHQEAWLGTIPTVYTEHPKGWTPRLRGNNFLHSRRQFRTTSKVAHSWLDHRYPKRGLAHVGVSGGGLSKNVAVYVKNGQADRPLILEELCFNNSEEAETEAKGVLKRRRLTYKQSRPKEPFCKYGKNMASWETVFKELEAKVPRVGNFVFAQQDDPKDTRVGPRDERSSCRGL